ncbi:hypothetical protein ACJX0J_007419, partial [Zea mays]
MAACFTQTSNKELEEAWAVLEKNSDRFNRDFATQYIARAVSEEVKPSKIYLRLRFCFIFFLTIFLNTLAFKHFWKFFVQRSLNVNRQFYILFKIHKLNRSKFPQISNSINKCASHFPPV